MSLAAGQLEKRWSALLGASLETWAHQLLYSRCVYPHSAFGPTRFLGVRFHLCRHPDVVSYIKESVKVAVPSLVSGVADEISFIIVDEPSSSEEDEDSGRMDRRELERYVLRMSNVRTDWKEAAAAAAGDSRQLLKNLESGMRDLLLQVLSLESTRASSSSSDSVSFRITLHIPEENASCPALNQAFAEGTWFSPSDSAAAAAVGNGEDSSDAPTPPRRGRQVMIRPLFQLSTDAVKIRFLRKQSVTKTA